MRWIKEEKLIIVIDIIDTKMMFNVSCNVFVLTEKLTRTVEQQKL